MQLLAIDTTTEACSVALWEGDSVLAEQSVIEPRGHTRRLLPMIEALLDQADWRLDKLTGLVCTRGPGSFTGVRVGISAAQGLAFAANLPVFPVSTLALLAWQGHALVSQHDRWQVAMDARMGEVYYAAYAWTDEEGLLEVETEQLLSPDQVPQHTASDWGRIGTGWALPALAGTGATPALPESSQLPQAASAAALAHAQLRLQPKNQELWVLPEALQPVYLRDQVTHQH